MALPATKVSAPASATRRMLSTLIPPSTSRRMSLPLARMRWRTASTLRSAESIKPWPPKPGLTLMIKIKSMSSITQSSTSSGCAGLNTSPACTPCALMAWMLRCTWPLASGWKLIRSAPACANADARASTGCTIKCTSIGTAWPAAVLACGLSAWQTMGPKVRLGT